MTEYRKFTRRQALAMGLGAAAVASLARADVTPAQPEGPFYPVTDQPDEDLDLTRIDGHASSAQGQVIVVEGRVLDEAGEPVPEALVEIWQANKFGRYHHERDPATAPLDPDFQGWGHVVTDAEGRYRFRTIKPGAYAATGDWTRPPHIHFKVARRGFHELITQMYFAGEPLNERDRLLQSIPREEQARLIVDFTDGEDPHSEGYGHFDIVMRAVT